MADEKQKSDSARKGVYEFSRLPVTATKTPMPPVKPPKPSPASGSGQKDTGQTTGSNRPATPVA